MAFLAPYMLLGGLAAAIPIALHFFYRSRYRNVPWAAMKFLLAAIEQTSRRLRFQELLLLILRVAVLLLLALALARPTSSTAGLGGRGDAVDAVLILDQSLSMTARAGTAPPSGSSPYLDALRHFARPDGSVTCLDRARAAATTVVEQLPPGSSVQVIVCSDRASLLGPRVPSHLDQGRKVIEEVPATALGTDFSDAFRLAAEIVERGGSPNKEVYLFSDMQRRGVEARLSSLQPTVAALAEKARVHFVHCAPSAIGNVAITGITPQSTLRTGERADFAVVVRNSGKKRLSNLTVRLELDGDAKARDSKPIAALAPGDSRAMLLSVRLDRPGRHVLTASVGPDELEGDNRYDQVIQVSDQVGVLLVDGAPDPIDPKRAGSYFLQHAINPTAPGAGVGQPVTLVEAGRAGPADLGGKEVCVVVNARLAPAREGDRNFLAPELVRALATFVQSGKGLMVFAGSNVDPKEYTRVLFEQHRLLPFPVGQPTTAPKDRPWVFDRASAAELPFGRFKAEKGYVSLDRIETRRHFPLDEAPNAELAEESRVLLRYSNGRAAIAGRKRAGQGEVLFFSTSVHEADWSDWYIAPTFVPLVQIALNHLLEGRPQAFNRTAGKPLVWAVPEADAEQAFDLVSPGGARSRLGHPVTTKGRALLTATETPQVGLYRLVGAGRDVTARAPLFAVTADLSETEDLETLSSGQIDEQLKVSLTHLKAGDEGDSFSGAERLRREWTPWLLVGLLVVAEMALAWYCGRGW
jgi:hypothetical protein